MNCTPFIFGIPSGTYVSILGVTFQSDCKLNTHVKNKLVKANKCLYVLKSLRKEGYKQAEIDFLFDTSSLWSIRVRLHSSTVFFRSFLEKEFYYKEL